MSRRLRFKFTFFTIVLLLILVVGYLAFGNVFTTTDTIPEDQLTQVKSGDLALAVVATGSIVPVATVEIKSKASGLVKEIFVEEGDRVESGQILAELDKELLQAELREAEANLLAAQASLEEGRSQKTSAESMKQKLEMDLRNLEDRAAYHAKQVGRFEQLFAEKLIPHSDLEDRERLLQESRFAAEALRSELLMQEARIEAAEKAVHRVQAQTFQAQAALDRARENLRYATIRSPLSATVLKRHVEVGDAVSSILQLGSQATLMMILGDMSEVYFEGRVDETDIGKVFDGQQARVRVDAFRDQPLQGEVLRIAPLGEEEDNVIGFEVRVAIVDPERILRAQMSANAEIIVQEKENILLIPEASIIYDEQRKTKVELYAPEEESLRQRVDVEIGISDGTTTEIVSGLREGDTILKSSAGDFM